MKVIRRSLALATIAAISLAFGVQPAQARTAKPVLHARHWLAITGKPLAATAGAMMFQKGGNAVDATAAMLAATCTMWDTLGWGGETQALIWNPKTGKVIGINALGVAPTGATPEFYRGKGMAFPPEFGPLAAVTPGTPGGLLVMLAEYGKLSLADVLGPAIQMADGFPIEAQLADRIEADKARIKEWPASKAVLLPHLGEAREAPRAGEVFRQPDLAATLRKLVEAEAQALAAGKSRKEAIQAAYDRFYKGDIADELVRGTREQGGLFTKEDLARWQVHIEEPVKATYKGIDVYKLTTWTQGPALLQTLNLLEPLDLRGMGLNSSRYIHTLYQAMNLAFADRDFYYGDPYFPPEEPLEGLLSKEYADARRKEMDPDRNNPAIKPGDPYPFQGEKNPFLGLLGKWGTAEESKKWTQPNHARLDPENTMTFDESFRAGTTSIIAADEEGWLVSVTPSGGWIPAFIAGKYRRRPLPAHAELRARRGAEPVQRAGPRQAPAGDPDPHPGRERRQALARLRRAGRRHPGPEPPPVLPRRGRVRHERPGSGGRPQHHELPDAQLLRGPRVRARPRHPPGLHPALGPGRAEEDGLQDRPRGAQLRPHQRHPPRPRERHDVGRVERLWGGLRDRVVRRRPARRLRRRRSSSARRAELSGAERP